MKFNKWTLGLAAIGVVSLASAAKADEKMTPIQSALSSTTISGYVDTSIHWNPGTGNGSVAPVKFQGPGKADGFNLDVVQLSIASPLDESEWASGYKVDLWFGPDANTLNTQSIFASGRRASAGDFAVRQAYVALRTPVGNGIDWKVGVFDSIIGYESLEAGNNPNYTRSYGHSIEPQTHTGVLATYRINDMFSVSGGIANTLGSAINERGHGPNSVGTGPSSAQPGNLPAPTTAESYKTFMGSIAMTAPESWGWASGSTLYAGVVNGFNAGIVDNQTSLYVGGTLATPVAGLKLGATFDWVDAHNFASSANNVWVIGGYASYQATEKLSAHLRAEYLNGEAGTGVDDIKAYEVTATLQYDLWKNVISRLEFRWDRADIPGGIKPFGGNTSAGTTGSAEDDVAAWWFDGYPGGTFEQYHSGSVLVEDQFLGVGGGFTQPGTHARENAFLVALNLIYKF